MLVLSLQPKSGLSARGNIFVKTFFWDNNFFLFKIYFFICKKVKLSNYSAHKLFGFSIMNECHLTKYNN